MISDSETVSARLQRAVTERDFTADAAQAQAAARLDVLRQDLAERPPAFLQTLRARLSFLPSIASAAPVRGLYLWGGVGRGKTLLMDLFFAALHFPRGTRRATRDHFYEFMRRVHADLGKIKNRAEPLDAVAQHIADRTRVLCLDEFLVSDIADAMLLSGLFEGLFRRGVTLVATSNTAPENLYRDGLQRQRFLPAIELIRTHVEVLNLDGGIDYRLRELEQAPTYVDSRLADADMLLERRFAALAGAAAAGGATLSIEGRPLQALALGPDMAWFEFRELCEGPRSQNDYIELARLYGTLFIAHIPVFTAHSDDAARRFIMLIDELYDRRVKIVVSAAAAPAVLYQGERLQFEFQRAASRLIEMQSQQYLAGEHRA